jgi:predicted ester cyclase
MTQPEATPPAGEARRYSSAGRSRRSTHTGELMGIPASGNPVEMRSIDIWRVQDGMFVEHWDELNLLEMLQQMGALPPLASGPPQDA